MSYPTGLEWTDATWNPIGGCSIASTGCKYCYAQQLAGTQQTSHRIAMYEGTTHWVRGRPIFNGKLTVAPPGDDIWMWPLNWRGAQHPRMGAGKRSLIFLGDMADLFHENRPTAHINLAVGTLAASPHIGQLVTKRADVMAAYFDAVRSPRTLRRWQAKLWLGFSAERQQEFDLRWPPMRPVRGGC